MPPLQALVALHGLWALVVLPFVVWAVRSWQAPPLRLVGCALNVAGLTTLAIFIGRELLTWYPAVAPVHREYIAQRILYVLGTNTDLPVVQVILAGVVLWFAARRRKRDGSLPETEPHPVEGLCTGAATRSGG